MDLTAVESTDPNTPLGILEFTGALPRAKLYSNWQVSTNQDATLARLADPAFDPGATVLVSDPIPAPLPANTNQPAGTVTINPNYKSKRVELEADAATPAVLLLNDKYSDKWSVTVDDQPATLLQCNFLMRGVLLQPGHHKVVFHFSVPLTGLYVSTSAVVIALSLCAFLLVSKPETRSDTYQCRAPTGSPGRPARAKGRELSAQNSLDTTLGSVFNLRPL